MHTRVCRMCGKPFAAQKTEALYCPECSRKRERLKKNQAAYRQRKKEAANNAD